MSAAPGNSPGTCPFQDGSKDGAIVLNANTGQFFRVQNAALRPLSADTFRALGSPAFTTHPGAALAGCYLGPPITAAVTKMPTSPPPTAPPAATLAPTPAATATPMGPPPPQLIRDPNLVIFVHRPSWVDRGDLRVMAIRGGIPVMEEYVAKDVAQVFKVDARSTIQSLTGPFVTNDGAASCSSARTVPNAPDDGQGHWQFVRPDDDGLGDDSPLAFSVVARCGNPLGVTTVGPYTVNALVSLDAPREMSSWYVVPIARIIRSSE